MLQEGGEAEDAVVAAVRTMVRFQTLVVSNLRFKAFFTTSFDYMFDPLT